MKIISHSGSLPVRFTFRANLHDFDLHCSGCCVICNSRGVFRARNFVTKGVGRRRRININLRVSGLVRSISRRSCALLRLGPCCACRNRSMGLQINTRISLRATCNDKLGTTPSIGLRCAFTSACITCLGILNKAHLGSFHQLGSFSPC